MIQEDNDIDDGNDRVDDVVVIDDADDDNNKGVCDAEYDDDDDDFDAQILVPLCVITSDDLQMSGDDGANRKQQKHNKNVCQVMDVDKQNRFPDQYF